jgi:hypothetical protein
VRERIYFFPPCYGKDGHGFCSELSYGLYSVCALYCGAGSFSKVFFLEK